MINQLAFVDPTAKIGKNVTIHAFAYIDKNVIIGDNNVIMQHATLLSGTRMGNDNKVYQGAVISATPQDFNFKGDDTLTTIGNNNVIRENVVINRATTAAGRTSIGNNNNLMQGCRLSHDVVLGDECIIGNASQIAGCTIVDNRAIVSACVLMHQSTRIGSWSLVQGGCRSNKDIPPYIIAAHEPIAYHGVNSMVLTHNGFSERIIKHIANAYRLIYQSNNTIEDALSRIEEQVPMSPEIEYIVNFIRQSKRGIIR